MKCKNCGSEFEGKFCPECGTKAEAETTTGEKKPKKSIYKRGWFICIVILLVLGVIASVTANKKEKPDWSAVILKEAIPQFPSNHGSIFINSEEELCVSLDKVTDEQYNKYLNQCMEQGFTVDTKKSTYSYDAFNSEGYSLNLTHIDDNLTITVKAPMKLGTITWPTGTAGYLLPEPSSTTGKFNYEHDTNFSVYVGDTDKEEYDEYVTDCSDYGFNVDYDKGENYYRAYNVDGYYLSLSYEGNNIMLVCIDEPEKGTETVSATEDAIQEAVKPEAEENIAESKTEETATAPEVEENGLRKDFKEAMDSYETFMNEYCDFMEKYNDNPTDPGLIADYMNYLSKYDDFTKKFDQWESEDLNDAELAYYIDVQTRVYDRLAKVGY